MVIVKLTCPWPHDYYSQSLNGKGLFGEYKFEINNACNYCDWWIIWGGILREEQVEVRAGRVIYITDEVHDRRTFNNKFLLQFTQIATVRSDLNRGNVIKIPEISPWYFKRNYDELLSLAPPFKSKELSVISSDLTWLDGHKKRFGFVNKLIGHFKDKIDVYGRGFNEIVDKYDVLMDYKYSVAIENNNVPGYFTEKISECFLTYTMPIYYGAPDIDNYYDRRSFLSIDIDNYKEAIKLIEELLATDSYSGRLSEVIKSRKNYLDNYHVFPAIIKIIQRSGMMDSIDTVVKKVRVLPEPLFSKSTEVSWFWRVKKAGKGIIRPFLKTSAASST
jgi:hypothetical protein